MAGQYTSIVASDYNYIQNIIDKVLGPGNTDPTTNSADSTIGYGLDRLSSQVSVHSKISVNQWSNLRSDIIKARQHQTGNTESLTVPTTSVKIAEADRLAYATMAELVYANRLITPPFSQASRENIGPTTVTATSTVAWNGTRAHYVTVEFASYNNARYFFNSGSSIEISASRTGGTNNTKNDSWTNLFNEMGIVRFGYTNTTSSGSGTGSNIGFYDLTTADQLIFQKDASTYAPNRYTIYARAVTSTQLVFSINFEDTNTGQPNLNPPWDIDENVDGTLTSTVQVYRSSGSNVSVSAPTGSYTVSNFYSPARVAITYTFTGNVANASLNITAIGGYVAGISDVTVIVNVGVYLYATSTGNAGLTLTGGSGADTLTLVNNGFIMGQGGVGGTPVSGTAGTAGGPALNNGTGRSITINNTNGSAYIGGGGGGGGGGASIVSGKFNITTYLGGGGGGAGGGGGGVGGYSNVGGGGGGIGARGGDALVVNDKVGGTGGTAGGAGGSTNAGGGGGGRVFSGVGGNNVSPSDPSNPGGSANNPGGNSYSTSYGGGGGGWGASGASSAVAAGGSGGYAVLLNGTSVTWVSGDTSRIYGAVG